MVGGKFMDFINKTKGIISSAGTFVKDNAGIINKIGDEVARFALGDERVDKLQGYANKAIDIMPESDFKKTLSTLINGSDKSSKPNKIDLKELVPGTNGYKIYSGDYVQKSNKRGGIRSRGGTKRKKGKAKK